MTLATWVYFAGQLAGPDDTIQFAMRHDVIWRSARKATGALIGLVRSLQPGDSILLVYRGGQPHIARVAARIAAVGRPVPGTHVIERIDAPQSRPLLEAGYPSVDNTGAVEVIHLEDVTECQIVLHGTYGGQGTIHRLAPEDQGIAVAPGPGQLPEDEEEGATRSVAIDSPSVDTSQTVVRTSDEVADVEMTPDDLELVAIRRPTDPSRMQFNGYVMVDWSSSSVPTTGKDSIWVAWGWWDGDHLCEDSTNVSTRSGALLLLRDLFAKRFAGRRVLLGLDFAFGYPRGFAAALELPAPPWRAILDEFRNGVEDDIGGRPNRHNRDTFAAGCNKRIGGGGPGPFWGCNAGAAGPDLTTRRVGVFDFPYAELEEYRETERRAWARGIPPQSVWKLNQGVSVGGQTILGIKQLADLCSGETAESGSRMAIWPFETGWGVPAGKDRIVLAEIFPSVLPIEDDLSGLVRDLAQVRTCVRHAANLDSLGLLAGQIASPPGLSDSQLESAVTEEGWILFVR
jgi:precorrin-8X/cobalt-precorrin-8 methylmutase